MFQTRPVPLALPARRVLLLAITTVLLLLSVVPSASAAAPVIRQGSLEVSVADGVVTATTSVTSARRTRVDEVGVCVRSAIDEHFDLPKQNQVWLDREVSTFTFTGTAAIPIGTYVFGTCVRVGRSWSKLSGWKRMTVPKQATSSSQGSGVAAVPARLSGAWRLQLDQTFDSDRLDRSVWEPSRWGGDADQPPFNPALEDAQFNSQNVVVSGNMLSFRTTRANTTDGDREYHYRSGTASTQGTFALRDESYVEAEVRVPRGSGLWPAFWAVPSGDWPPEIDIFEFFDTATDSRPEFNYHYRDAGGDLRQTGPLPYGVPGVDYRSGWHTYGLQRTGGRLVPWLDGVPYPDVSTAGPGDVPMFLILNLSVRRGSRDPGGASMDVRHVRAWSKR